MNATIVLAIRVRPKTSRQTHDHMAEVLECEHDKIRYGMKEK